MRISKLSQLAFPLPQGVFLTVWRNRFVGKGIGPDKGVFVFPAMSTMSLQMVFSLPISMLLKLILAVGMDGCFLVDL